MPEEYLEILLKSWELVTPICYPFMHVTVYIIPKKPPGLTNPGPRKLSVRDANTTSFPVLVATRAIITGWIHFRGSVADSSALSWPKHPQT